MRTVNFTDLPPAALNSGVRMRCNPLVAGQPYFWMESDGSHWRPWCGAQVIYSLAAPVVFTDDYAYQLGISVPIPPKLLPDGRARLRTVMGGSHEGGTSDSLNYYTKIGPLSSLADPTIYQTGCALTNLSVGGTYQAYRVSDTQLRKQGAGGTALVAALSGTSIIARLAPIDVANLDLETNYYNVWQDLITGGLGEYGVLHAFTLELIG